MGGVSAKMGTAPGQAEEVICVLYVYLVEGLLALVAEDVATYALYLLAVIHALKERQTARALRDAETKKLHRPHPGAKSIRGPWCMRPRRLCHFFRLARLLHLSKK